jgi:hypothetical protein
MEALTTNTRKMVKSILETIKAVDNSPSVAQSDNGLHKPQRTSKKKQVDQSNTALQEHE